MRAPVDLAVANNRIWCAIVCDSHGIAHDSNERVWGALSKAPPYYPDAITIHPDVTLRDVEDFMENREFASMKDSYANLDLSSRGFNVLFEAEWIYHAPAIGMEPAESSWQWHAVASEEDLLPWSVANGTETVIRTDLLRRNDVKIYMREEADGLSGFIASLGGNAIGISNVFSTGRTNESIWTDIVSIVSKQFPGIPMVGYERDDDLAAALASGWTSIGPLRVWVR
ncbi:hypothetical protein [Cohnella caldifontis]|uniref:hypothetical protein n=1 Tax=Cohnella caldifontis TaxID=3027471 RepID=UPI0023EBD8FD|nr:hypothetical protein [Cohnella sp. YIM B05605]